MLTYNYTRHPLEGGSYKSKAFVTVLISVNDLYSILKPLHLAYSWSGFFIPIKSTYPYDAERRSIKPSNADKSIRFDTLSILISGIVWTP